MEHEFMRYMRAYNYYYIVHSIKRGIINRAIIIYYTARASRRDEENINNNYRFP